MQRTSGLWSWNRWWYADKGVYRNRSGVRSGGAAAGEDEGKRALVALEPAREAEG